MNKQTMFRTLIVAVPVGVAALAAAYFYRGSLLPPAQEAVEAASAPAVGEDKTGKVEKQTTSVPIGVEAGDRQQEQETAAQTDAPEATEQAPVEGPSFDVVGVEPTGETVVAGRSDAGAIVALTANGEVVGKSIANEAGEWTIILEEPLKPGDYDVGLEVHDEKGDAIEESGQRLAVSVPEDGQEKPLVVLNDSEGPSDILQKPKTEIQVADANATAEKQAVANQSATATTSERTADGEDTVIAALPKTAVEDNTSESRPSQLAEQQPAQSDGGADGQTAGSVESGSGNQAPSVEVAVNEQPGTPRISSDTAALNDGQAAAADGNVSGREQASATGTGQAVTPAPENSEGQGAAQASNSAGTPQPKPAADGTPVTASAGNAQARTETAAEVGSGTGVQQSSSSTASADTGTGSQQPASSPDVTVEAVESEPDKVYVAGTGKPGSSVRVYVGEDFQGEAKVNSSGKWLVEGTKNVAEGNVEVRVDLIAKDGNTVDARAAVTFEKEQDKQIVLTKVVATGAGSGQGSQGADVQKSLPVVIIRKGDNLWRISRRLYGDGVRYTTIYQANQDQIRDPDLIYPGQVFLTPEGDLNWPDRSSGNANRG
ncbi:LysM peptidoglycan-binding domain-containing protein [Labrenzia sp. DG1229]|uniref:LysM peptidoglycan-binding domain-containing protein n=1 Tax=Labrenzia sp. DG1229 TaxID=681847 RepID=UPI00048B5CAC|nr:LysM peptidoglycan-binding domain-containing protein [Labrenzia sp. DG1229]